ncbi:Hypp6860 [Branchiostoma lanceolatum]|uniref:Hypp6860 protein n=1 Tax=Branchiostoma lanceolatum TaxID=7740 RepID=A0A8J9YVP6_BRALA|nr:Hypp6860 [Branchiostoma lanceolatum]
MEKEFPGDTLAVEDVLGARKNCASNDEFAKWHTAHFPQLGVKSRSDVYKRVDKLQKKLKTLKKNRDKQGEESFLKSLYIDEVVQPATAQQNEAAANVHCECAKLKKELKVLRQELYMDIQKTAESEKEKAVLKKQDVSLDVELVAMKRQLKKIQNSTVSNMSYAKMEKELNRIKSVLSETKKKVTALKKHNIGRSLRRANTNHAAQRESWKREGKMLRQKMSELSRHNANLKTKLDKQRSTFQKRKLLLKRSKKKAQASASDRKKEVEKCKEKAKSMGKTIQTLREKNQLQEKKVARLEETIEWKEDAQEVRTRERDDVKAPFKDCVKQCVMELQGMQHSKLKKMAFLSTSNLQPFPPHEGSQSIGPRWKRWIDRFENYFVAYNITTDERKKALLLHLVGEETSNIYRNLAPDDTDDFAGAKERLNTHFGPQVNKAMEFHVRTRCNIQVIINEKKGRTVYGTWELREQYRAGTLRSLASDTTHTSESIMEANQLTVLPLPNTPPKSFPEGVGVTKNMRSFLFADGESPTKVSFNTPIDAIQQIGHNPLQQQHKETQTEECSKCKRLFPHRETEITMLLAFYWAKINNDSTNATKIARKVQNVLLDHAKELQGVEPWTRLTCVHNVPGWTSVSHEIFNEKGFKQAVAVQLDQATCVTNLQTPGVSYNPAKLRLRWPIEVNLLRDRMGVLTDYPASNSKPADLGDRSQWANTYTIGIPVVFDIAGTLLQQSASCHQPR